MSQQGEAAEQKLFEKLCGGMLGGRNHRSWLHHL